MSETNRAKEFQRGTAGVLESTKEGATGLPEGSDIGLGAGGPGFESPHSDQILQKNRLNRRFFCILSLIFVVLEIAVLRRFQWWNSGRGMSERSHRNRQIPNPSLTGKLPHFLRFYRCRCRPLLIVCLRCVGREAGFLLL